MLIKWIKSLFKCHIPEIPENDYPVDMSEYLCKDFSIKEIPWMKIAREIKNWDMLIWDDPATH